MTYMIKKAPTSDTGISIKGRTAIVQSLKNKKMMMTTKVMAINMVSFTSEMDFLMNLVLSTAIFSLISAGISDLNFSTLL